MYRSPASVPVPGSDNGAGSYPDGRYEDHDGRKEY